MEKEIKYNSMPFIPMVSNINSKPIAKEIKCNILMIGKTGVGKSSFGNYLFDENLFRTGNGKPVTNFENNFENYSFLYDELEINVYDSVGLEPNNFGKWEKEFNNFLQNFENGNELNFIHTIFYMINAKSSRIEEKEINLIKKIYIQRKIPIQIILTNCDGAEKEKIEGIENTLIENFKEISIKRVCSISRIARGGIKYESFGKNDVLNEFVLMSYNYSCKKIALFFLKHTNILIGRMKNKIISFVESLNLGIFNMKNWTDELEKLDLYDFDNLLEETVGDFAENFEKYINFLESFNLDITEPSSFNKVEDFLENIDDNLNNVINPLEEKFEKIFNDLENGNFIEKIGAFANVAGFVLKLKKNMIELINDVFHSIEKDMRDLTYEIKNIEIFDNRK